MNFLYPLFLAGCFAILLPLLFHLIRRSTKTKVPFSALRFLQPSLPRLTRKSRLEHLWLLLLRCLILILLALAFARPYLQKALTPQSSQNPRRHLFLIDSSASMRRDRTWDRALQILSEKLAEMDPQSLAAIYSFDMSLHRMMSFEQWEATPSADRKRQILNRAKRQSPSWRATHLGNALMEGMDLLEESARMNEDSSDSHDGRMIVISDLQSGMFLDGIGELEWHKGLVVEFIPVELESSTNAGIHILTNPQAGFLENEIAQIRIANTSDSQKESFEYGWIEKSSDLQLTSQTEIYLPPGKSRVVEIPKLPDDFSPDILRLVGDEHDFDNIAWRVPLRARQSQVLYFGQSQAADSSQPLYYLEKAFQQTRHHVVHLKRISPDNPLNQLTESEFDDPRLIVIASPLDPQLTDSVRRLISNGATGLLVLHREDLASTLQSLVDDSIDVAQADPSNYALLSEIDFQHPIFKSFADPRFSDFSKIKFWQHYRIQFDETMAAVLARFDDGSPALAQFDLGRGSLLVAAFGWQPRQSQFALSTKFVPFLYSLLDFGESHADIKSQYLVGQSVDLSSLTGAISITKPDGKRIELKGKRFDATSIPGIYTIEGEASTRFAVNLDPRESDTTPLPEETLAGLGIPMAVSVKPESSPIAKAAQAKLEAVEIESTQKYWKWLVLAALLLATIETFFAGLLARRSI